eukprot:403351868
MRTRMWSSGYDARFTRESGKMSHHGSNGSNRLIIPNRTNNFGNSSKNASPVYRQDNRRGDQSGTNIQQRQDSVSKFAEENKDLRMNLNNMDSEDNQNWYEVRVLGKNPERRGYHSSFICNKKLYIYGGHDIREGSLNSLWMLNLGHLSDLDKPENEQDKKLMWHHTDTSGPSPGAISHHTSVVFNERMYLFGGSKANGEENSKFFSLDLKSYRWEVIQSRGQVPTTRDEHTALIYEGSLIIFGGFVNGVRSNEIYRYYFNDNRWELVQQLSDECPPARAGHSAIQYGDSMYIFGGKDEDNNKLNDIWQFNFNTYIWTEVACGNNPEQMPLPRSGHTASLYKDQMVIFGGIHEVTKELDDMMVFDIKSRKWVSFFEEQLHSPHKNRLAINVGNQNSGRHGQYVNNSPSSFKKKQSFMINQGQNAAFKIEMEGNTSNHQNSPNARGKSSSSNNRKSLFSSQTTSRKNSSKRTSLMRQSMISQAFGLPNLHLHNAKDTHHQVELESPTSISMKNSFIIKNADPSFDSYYKQMTRRKINLSISQPNAAMYIGGANQSYFSNAVANHSDVPNMQLYGKVQGKRPAARDGHTGLIYGDNLLIFGGDRHHMPFNDMFMLDLKTEFISKGHLFSE